jgi:histidinol-phosphatase (PHP family)
VYRFEQALRVWDHPFWQRYAHDDLDDYCQFVREETDLKLGIEADFIPGREDRMANLLDGRGWDYVVGSVHFIGDRALDTEEFSIWTQTASAENIWRRYFEMLGEAAQSGLFDIMAHPDLVKVWGKDRPLPDGDLRRFYYPAMEAIADAGVAVEVSTAGFRKPVGEIYPAPAFLEMAIDAGAPLALSSDAHVPEQLGWEYGKAVELLESLGVKEIAVFEKRERRLEPLG